MQLNWSDHRGHSYTIFVIKMGRLVMLNMKHIQLAIILAEQHGNKQRRPQGGWRPAKVNGPSNPWDSDCRMEVTLGKTQTHNEMVGIRAVHLLYNRVCSPILEMKRTIPLLLSRLTWSALCVTENQTALPILIWQKDLGLSAQAQRTKIV